MTVRGCPVQPVLEDLVLKLDEVAQAPSQNAYKRTYK